MFPVMIYQTRFAATACHGFAEIYENQPYNPVLTLLPALDGPRNERVLVCIDRNKPHGGEFAIELHCTADTPAHSCHSGKVEITRKHTFHGDIVYPKLMVEPTRDIQVMKEVEWVDLQTDTVSLSTLIYTEGVEIFTSLTVDFKMDEAGNVDASYTMISYRDMIQGSKATFIACLCVCSIGAFIGVILSVYYLLTHSIEGKRGSLFYELVSRLVLFIYPIVLLVEWSQQIPMSEEYDHLLHSFLDLPGIEEAQLEVGIQKYFDAKTHIYHEITWMKRHRIVAYVVCYVQFLQLVSYFNNHPRMAILTATVNRALGNISHFLALFGMLYVMLAFMAHWMLGPYIPEFGTIGETMASQVRMVFGEFIQASNVDALKGSMMVMYWLYAGTFMLLVIWTLLNFFLAIIVDAFVEVKEENEKNVAARDFLTDIMGVVWAKCVAVRQGWPDREALIKFFEQHAAAAELRRADSANRPSFVKDLEDQKKAKEGQEEEEPKMCPPDAIREAFVQFQGDRIGAFLVHYHNRCPSILNAKEATEAIVALKSGGSAERQAA